MPKTIRGNDYWPAAFRQRGEQVCRKDVIAVDRNSQGGRPEMPPAVAAAIAALGDDPFHGARLRHVIDDGAEVSDMEAEAVRRALRAAGTRPDEIGLVMVSSTVPDCLLPSNGPAIQAKCELVNATAWSVELGCASIQPQLVAAAALLRDGVCSRAMIVASTATSRIVDYAEPVSALLGDGASAAVIGPLPPGHGLLGQWMRTDGSLRDGVVHAPVVDGKPQRRWDRVAGPIRATSFDLDVAKTAGRRAAEFCREACHGALAAAGLDLKDVSLFVSNQVTGWFVDACRRALDLPEGRAVNTFPEVGNIGAAAVIYNLARAQRDGRLKDGDVVLMYSQGAGLTRVAAVYRWSALTALSP